MTPPRLGPSRHTQRHDADQLLLCFAIQSCVVVKSEVKARLVGGRYRIEKRLGQGGMGTVFHVVDESNNEPLALKQILDIDDSDHVAGSTPDENALLRFRREFHTMVGMRHPRIIEVRDYGVDEASGPYYTMELLDGQDLRDVGQLDVARACHILRDVAAALAFLHARRLVHRDLTPRNVRCTKSGGAKLIDFGVVAAVGTSGEIAGTPPFIAPESLRGLTIDHRTDLFALGALAYWLMTGTHAYPARNINELEALWRRSPPPLPEDIPKAMTDLVTALLCLDPLGRPASAAEVIGRLTAAGGLEPDPEIEVSQGYLASAVMVGRRVEMAKLRIILKRVVDGKGGAVLIEAPSGTGKTRLMYELALEAKLSGITVAVASAESSSGGPYGLLREITRELLISCAEDTIDTARDHAPLIARFFPELEGRLGKVKHDSADNDPASQRIRASTAIAAWLRDLSERRPLAIMVDDMQRCDEASAAVLATLAREASECQLLIAVTLRTDEDVRAAVAVAALQDAGTRLPLSGLDEDEVEELMRSLFGDVPRLASVAQWLHGVTGGNPLYCTELARHLVDQNVIRYLDGIWVLPQELRLDKQPEGLAGAMDVRIAQLGESARAMAEVLAVHGGDLPLGLCLALCEESEEHAFAALDELVGRAVLLSWGDTHKFRHDGLREAALRGIPEDRRAALHLRVGKAIAGSDEVEPAREAEIGWHLFHGGDTAGSADLLERAGRRLFEGQGLSDCIGPLQTALQLRREQGARPSSYLDLQYMLLTAGYLTNRPAFLRHGREALMAYRRYTGIDLAERLSRYLGRHLGLVFGLGWSLTRWLFSRPRHRGPNPIFALSKFLVSLVNAAACEFVQGNHEGLRELVEFARPLSVFRRRLPYAAYLGTTAAVELGMGRFDVAAQTVRCSLHIIATDRLTPVKKAELTYGDAAGRALQAVIDALRLAPELPERIKELDDLGLRYYQLGTKLSELLVLRLRGEEELARGLDEELSTSYLQLGSSWSINGMQLWVSALAYGLCHDVLGLRRCIELMPARIEEGYQIEVRLALARGEYFRECGDLEESEKSLLEAIDHLQSGEVFMRLWVLAALAETTLGMNQPDRARDLAQECIDLGAHQVFIVPRLRAQRALALAEAALGHADDAILRLSKAVNEAEPLRCPPLTGSLHEAWARVALAVGDRGDYDLHSALAGHALKSTGNSALVAMSERLAELVATSRSGTGAATAPAIDAVTVKTVPTIQITPAAAAARFRDCRGPAERATRALELLLQASSATSGFLYLVTQEGLAVAAPQYGAKPDEKMTQNVETFITDSIDASRTLAQGSTLETAASGQWQPILIELRVGANTGIVGVAVAIQGVLPLQAPEQDFIERIAQALFEAGDVATVDDTSELWH